MLHENNEENVWLNQLYWGEGSLEAVLFDIIHASNKYYEHLEILGKYC